MYWGTGYQEVTRGREGKASEIMYGIKCTEYVCMYGERQGIVLNSRFKDQTMYRVGTMKGVLRVDGCTVARVDERVIN